MQNQEMVKESRNDFRAFAIGEEANVIAQAEYEKSGFLREGFKKGMARSSEINKAIRQGSSIAAAVAKFTAEKTGEDILDNGDIDTLSQHIETAISSVSSQLMVAEAEGTSDALTGSFSPAIKELKNGLMVHVRAATKNTAANPTFRADQTGEKAIVKGNNLPLETGDIAGAGHWLEMQYDSQLDKWVLQNPAKGISPLNGVPVGTVEYFAMATPPAGYLKADGAAVGRETYPELFAAIGTAFGGGDGSTTFNLPDLINRFAQGSLNPGQKIEAGLPNITGAFAAGYSGDNYGTGAFVKIKNDVSANAFAAGMTALIGKVFLDASRSNSIYGFSETVQPPALTLLPCIKAFDATSNPGLIDITGLANEMNEKLDRKIGGTSVKYVTETYDDGSNWYRKWSDGWLEQGGHYNQNINNQWVTTTLLQPYVNTLYIINVSAVAYTDLASTESYMTFYPDKTTTAFKTGTMGHYRSGFYWSTAGQGAQS